MLARLRKSAENKDSGFTLIELLVVMIIIGILAAIAIPAFLSQKKKAREASAKSDVTTIGKEIAAYYVDGATTGMTLTGGTGTWALTDSASAAVADGKLSNGNTTAGSITDSDTFCVYVTPSQGDAWQYSQDGLAKGTC